MNLGAPAPLPAVARGKVRRQGCRRSQKRLEGVQRQVRALRIRPELFLWLALKKGKAETSVSAFREVVPSLWLTVSPLTVSGDDHVLGRGCIRGRAHAIGHGARAGKRIHNEPAMGM